MLLKPESYDMLCLEGISRALKVFIGKEDIPVYRAIKPDNPIRIKAHPDVVYSYWY